MKMVHIVFTGAGTLSEKRFAAECFRMQSKNTLVISTVIQWKLKSLRQISQILANKTKNMCIASY